MPPARRLVTLRHTFTGDDAQDKRARDLIKDLDPLLRLPFLGAQIVRVGGPASQGGGTTVAIYPVGDATDLVALVASSVDNVLPHGLGRPWTGFVSVAPQGSGVVYTNATSGLLASYPTSKFIILRTTVAMTTRLVIFLAVPLQRSVVNLPLVAGVDESSDARAQQPGSFAVVQNGVWNKAGVVTKRNGYGQMGTLDTNGNALPAFDRTWTENGKLFALSDAQTGTDQGSVYEWLPTPGTWLQHDDAPRALSSKYASIRGAISSSCACLYSQGILWLLWISPTGGLDSGIYLRGLDPNTSAILVTDRPITVGSGVFTSVASAMVMANGKLALGGSLGTSNAAILIIDVVTTPYAPTSVTNNFSVSGWSGQNPYILSMVPYAVVNTTSLWCAVSRNNGGTFSLDVVIYDTASFAATSLNTRTGTIVPAANLCAGSSNAVYLAYSGADLATGSARAQSISYPGSGAPVTNSSSATYGGITNNQGAIDVATLGRNALVFATSGTVSGRTGLTTVMVNSVGLFGINSKTTPNATLASRLWTDGRSIYAAVLVQPISGQAIGTAFACNLTRNWTSTFRQNAQPLATLCVERASGYGVPVAAPVAAISSTRVGLPVNVLATGTSGGQTDVFSVDLTGGKTATMTGVNGATHIATGVTGVFDGRTYVEAGFCHPPHVAGAPFTGTQLSVGTYGYAAHYEWYDARGDLHRSAAAVATVVVTSASSADVALTFNSLGVTSRGSGALAGSLSALDTVSIAVYRTLVNSPGPYYRLTPPVPGSYSSVVPNNGNALTTTYADTTSDTALAALGYGTLYDSAELDATFPTGANALASCNGRLWLASSDDTRVIYYTKPLVRGIAPEWSDALYLTLDASADPVTALSSLDDTLVIFTGSRIYTVSGDGPSATGQGGSFNGPSRVQAGAGCQDPRSLAKTDDGIYFLDSHGITLLDRKLAITFVGAPLEQTVDANPTLTSASHDAVRQRIYWTTQGAVAGLYVVVMYDYEHNTWSSWQINFGAGLGGILRGGALYNGLHVLVNAAGVFGESFGPNPQRDPGNRWVQLTLTSPWIRPAQFAGYARVWKAGLSGTATSPCTVALLTFVDYNSAITNSAASFDSVQMGLSTPGQLRIALSPKTQQCEAIQMTVYDAPASVDTGSGSGLEVLSLNLELGVYQNYARLAAANRR